jgi:adenylosuccinate synthase
MADLPPEARAYLDRLEQLCDTPIAFVSVGTRRDQIIPLTH